MNDLEDILISIDAKCSICSSKNVYFKSIERFLDKEEENGRIYIYDTIELTYYCQECFHEYGGKGANYG